MPFRTLKVTLHTEVIQLYCDRLGEKSQSKQRIKSVLKVDRNVSHNILQEFRRCEEQSKDLNPMVDRVEVEDDLRVDGWVCRCLGVL